MSKRIDPASLDTESLRDRLNEFASDGEYESYVYKSVLQLEEWVADLTEYLRRRRENLEAE